MHARICLPILGLVSMSACGPKRPDASETRLRVSLQTLMQAEEAYYSEHKKYGTIAELGTSYATFGGHRVTVALTSDGYTATATDGARTCTFKVPEGKTSC